MPGAASFHIPAATDHTSEPIADPSTGELSRSLGCVQAAQGICSMVLCFLVPKPHRGVALGVLVSAQDAQGELL